MTPLQLFPPPFLPVRHHTSPWMALVKKLKLDLDELAVVSFEVDNSVEEQGTVHGAEGTDDCTISCGDPFSSLYRYYRMLTTY